MIAAAAIAVSAWVVVAADHVALRAAPATGAPQQAALVQGESLEVRGRRLDYLQVWDYRRERGGYVRAEQTRPLETSANAAPQLLTLLTFLRAQPGAESLAIAYAAAYLKAAPRADAEVLEMIGSLAERLARRASRQGGTLAASQIEAVAQYGVKLFSVERDGAVQLCYDGDAFRRALDTPSAQAQTRAKALLALTRSDCVDAALRPSELALRNESAALMLEAVDSRTLPASLANRMLMRRAALWSGIAFEQARLGKPAQSAAAKANEALLGVDRQELLEDEQSDYHEAALRVSASRWAMEPINSSVSLSATRLTLSTVAGDAGQSCVQLHDDKEVVLRRCTYGVAWLASARLATGGQTITLAVQPLAGWRELWLLRKGANGWAVEVMPPAGTTPHLGYVESAGFVPGAQKLLLAREYREASADGRFNRRFEVMSLDSLTIERHASTPSLLVLFERWQDPTWKQHTVSLR